MIKKKLSPSQIAIRSDEALDKIMGKKKIEKLTIDLYDGKTMQEWEPEYQKAKKEWVAKELSYSYNENKRRDAVEAEWDADHPNGVGTWVGNRTSLNAHGEMKLINKINELVEELNRR